MFFKSTLASLSISFLSFPLFAQDRQDSTVTKPFSHFACGVLGDSDSALRSLGQSFTHLALDQNSSLPLPLLEVHELSPMTVNGKGEIVHFTSTIFDKTPGHEEARVVTEHQTADSTLGGRYLAAKGRVFLESSLEEVDVRTTKANLSEPAFYGALGLRRIFSEEGPIVGRNYLDVRVSGEEIAVSIKTPTSRGRITTGGGSVRPTVHDIHCGPDQTIFAVFR